MARLRIKEVALQRGIRDAAKLARRADVAYGTVKKLWDDPEGDTSLKTLEKIADALGVTVVELFEVEEPEEELLTLDAVPA